MSSLTYIYDYPLPSAEEERELIYKAQEGNKKAFDYLVLANSKMVNNMATKFRNKGLEYEVLYQEGMIGLIKSIRNFDLSKNLRLSTYAYVKIQQCMVRAIQNDSRIIRIPVHAFQKNFEFIVATRILEQELGRSATIEELAEYTNKSLKEVQIFTRDMIDTCSIDQVCEGGNKPSELIELIADEKAIDIVSEINAEQMMKVVKGILTEKEYRIFTEKIGLNDEPKSCEEIAATYNMQRNQVYGIYRRSLGRLKRNSNINIYKCS